MNDSIITCVDTIAKIVSLDKSFLILEPKESFFTLSVSLGDILTIIGMFVSFYVFRKQLKYSREANKQNLRSTWFLEVIVQPNIEMITKFYDNIIHQCDKATSELSNKYKNNEPAKTLNKELAKKQRELKDEIKTSLDHFQSMLKASEPFVADKIDEVLDKLVDVVTTHIDNYEKKQITSSKLEILNNKQEFFALLYNSWNK